MADTVQAEAAAPEPLASVYCASCGRDLTDELSRSIGLGPDCRAQLNYRHVSSLTDAQRIETNLIVHALAGERLRGAELRGAIFRLAELGFEALSKRVEQRFWRGTIEVTDAAPPAAPEPEPVVELHLPFNLTQGQEQALELTRRVAGQYGFGMGVIVGWAGTGKTTLIKVIGHVHGAPMIITPTGKAAMRVREATGLPAQTIHRWIYKPVMDEKTGVVKFVRREGNDIQIPNSRLVVLDEGSMVGPDVWRDVYSVCRAHDLRLIVVGDGFQLPPVQPPNSRPFSVLTEDFAQSLGAERVEMNEVVRQAQDSPVIRASIALRNGWGVRAFDELPKCTLANFGQWALNAYRQGGVTICHRNQTRLHLNAMFRASLGIYDEMPVVGEPLIVLKNAYEVGLVNGESFAFEGWTHPPGQYERVHDKWKNKDENARFGGTTANGISATVAVEELHGRMESSPIAISIAASRWARGENFYAGDKVASHLHANFGYVYTAHKSQGSQWPGVLVVVEPSVRLDEEDGRRWAYTAVTRAQQMAGVFLGKLV
jgi:exodeoxyribonuclease-5